MIVQEKDSVKILNWYAFLLICGLVSIHPAKVCALDYGGQWLGTITESLNWCERIGKADPGDYKLTIIHKGNHIVVMENVNQRPYSGVINPKLPKNVSVHGAYNIDGG